MVALEGTAGELEFQFEIVPPTAFGGNESLSFESDEELGVGADEPLTD